MTSKPTVFFINHREEACGVYQYGRRLARILGMSQRINLVYTEVDSQKDWDWVLVQTDASAFIYNYTDLTLQYLTLNTIQARPGAAHFALYHEGTLPWGPTAAPGEPKRLPMNAWMLVTDSTHTDTADALAIPRPLADPCILNPRTPSYPIISSFGFGLRQKGFRRLVEQVNREFDIATIRLRITQAAFYGDAAKETDEVIEECHAVARKPGVQLDITRHFSGDSMLMSWLGESSLCTFLYDDFSRYRGLSSVIDYALSALVPIAVTRTTMFRHITDASPSICVEDRSLREIMQSGTKPLDSHRAKWSHTALIQRFEQILSRCIMRKEFDSSHDHSEEAARITKILNETPFVAPQVQPKPAPQKQPEFIFLQSQSEIDQATKCLIQDGIPTNTACPPKNWDLWKALAHVNGNVLDLGCGTDGSFFLKACSRLELGAERWGIDVAKSPPVDGAQVIQGDLTHTPFRSGYFQTLVSLSVIEHGIDLQAFATECARLLSVGGKLVISFDAFEPKIKTDQIKMYGKPWCIFSRTDIEDLIEKLNVNGFTLTAPIDWKPSNTVICHPLHRIQYTFGFLVFEKKWDS
jgi:SAM-dependent methyltransferase